MRISDWSSDVCSSDLEDQEADLERGLEFAGDDGGEQAREGHVLGARIARRLGDLREHHQVGLAPLLHHETVERVARARNRGATAELFLAIGGAPEDRDSAVWGKMVSVHIERGSRRIT